jgi:hypothetical protein
MKVFAFCVFVLGGLLASYGLGLKHGDQQLRERNQSLLNNLVEAHCLVDKQWVQKEEYRRLVDGYQAQLDLALEALEVERGNIPGKK